jgi:hypothetical protein
VEAAAATEPVSEARVEPPAEMVDPPAPAAAASSAEAEPVGQDRDVTKVDASMMGDEADEEDDTSESAIGKKRRGIRLKQDLN